MATRADLDRELFDALTPPPPAGPSPSQPIALDDDRPLVRVAPVGLSPPRPRTPSLPAAAAATLPPLVAPPRRRGVGAALRALVARLRAWLTRSAPTAR